MNGTKIDLSATGRGRVILVSTLVTLACIALSFAISLSGLLGTEPGYWWDRILVNVIVPVAVAFPVMYFLMSKLRELAIAHERLTVYASTDGLTQVMNRAAFSTLVDAYLRAVRDSERRVAGALLIVDADNFKVVNDRYGHDRGDEALVAIAGSIKAILRSPDIVGRLGGEEFGVFLPGASTDQAGIVAELIRHSVNEASFAPAGATHRLSVSIGGAVFEDRLPFADLFRLADQQLYVAKRDGRNRVAISPVRDAGSSLAAA